MNTNVLTATAPDFLKLLAHDLRWQTLVALARSDYRVQELVELLERPANLVSYHLKRLQEMHLVNERRSAADRRDVYYSINLDRVRDLYFASGEALHPAMNGAARAAGETGAGAVADSNTPPIRVLFLCTHNSARSQMAEGIMRHLGGPLVEVYSAGTAPSSVHPVAVQTMTSLGIDLSSQRSKHLDEFRGQHFDYVITVCDRARESCPLFPDDPVQIHWSFPDPAAVPPGEEQRQAFYQTAIELMNRIRILLALMENERNNKAAGRATGG